MISGNQSIFSAVILSKDEDYSAEEVKEESKQMDI
jgi:hypothetical protein